MQGLGPAPIALSARRAEAALSARVAQGEAIAAFALSEPDAGSDVAAMTTPAAPTARPLRIDGCKTWISNGGIADHYVGVRAHRRSGGRAGHSRIRGRCRRARLCDRERIEVIAPHPLATLRFDGCRVPPTRRSATGEGFKVAMATLDIFRSSVGAAALGFARRALDEAIARAPTRKMFGGDARRPAD